MSLFKKNFRDGALRISLAILLLAQPFISEAATTKKSTEIVPRRADATVAQLTDPQGPYRCDVVKPTSSGTDLLFEVPDGKTNAWQAPDQRDGGRGFSFVFCSDQASAQITEGRPKGTSSTPGVSGVALLLSLIMFPLLSLLATIGNWLLWISSHLLGTLLGLGSFITHPLVQSGWPLVQGLANIGFILALLFIAFATTLRLDTFSVRRMLPKLLIAAILINFSLVIAGVLIDASRVFMAIMVRVAGADSITGVGASLLASSRLAEGVFDTSSYVSFTSVTSSWGSLFQMLQGIILIWVLTIGMLVITVGLLIRYIKLIILIIFSPIGFLGFAFPGGEKLAKQWWGEFIKNVVYGPIALFILVLLVQLQKQPRNILGQPRGDSFFESLITVGITCAMCIAAAKAAKSVSGLGADAVLGFAAKNKWKAAGYGLKAGALPYKLADRGVDKLSGGRFSVGRGINNTKDFLDQRKKAQDKKELKRKKGSFGTSYGEYRYASKEKRRALDAERGAADNVREAHRNDRNNAADPALDPRNLRLGAVGQAISEEQIAAILKAPSSERRDQQVSNMVSNVEIVNKMSGDQRNNLLDRVDQILATRLPPGASQFERDDYNRERDFARTVLKNFNETIRKANEESSPKSK